jgi:HAD superfamily 5'-nucleotidase-like hydrolase
MTASLAAPSLPPLSRRVFANRTLNLRSIEAVGFDMDYTLIHYRTEAWERRAFDHAKARIQKLGWAVESLAFTPQAFTLGLVVDRKLGNVVKANRFGFVKRASHGTRPLGFDEQRAVYSRVLVDLAESRWQFMNTLFSLSEACLFAQLVDLLDAGSLPAGTSYEDVYGVVRTSLDAAHVEGALKQEIVKDPDRFVELDEELPRALLDLRAAGKKLLVITNSEWEYTRDMMSYTFDRFLPSGSWRSLFDLVIVGARKPEFFTAAAPIFEVVDESGLLRPNAGPLKEGGLYLGGNARLVERKLGCPGERILYVGDHIFSDVNVTKNLLRWRTALVLRALEDEITAFEAFRPRERELDLLMVEKETLEHAYDQYRLALLRNDTVQGQKGEHPGELRRRMQQLRADLETLDSRIAPLAKEAAELVNAAWGPMMRAGNDKSHLARQIERHADVYTSRVANLLYITPFAYLRSPRGNLPHDVA